MASLLDNLTKSLQEVKERLKFIEEEGPNAIKVIYPNVTLDDRQVYIDLIQSLPKEIMRLESRINNLNAKVVHKDTNLL